MANLVTAVLSELERTYVVASSEKDKKMRRRIRKTVELVNSSGEMQNLLIKQNPFHTHHHNDLKKMKTEHLAGVKREN